MAKRKRVPQNDAAEEKKEEEKAEEDVAPVAEEQDEDDERSFEELGLDARLVRALSKKSIENPTPIQRVAIPLILVWFLRDFLPAHSAVSDFSGLICACCDAGRQRCGGPSENRLRENSSLSAPTASEAVC